MPALKTGSTVQGIEGDKAVLAIALIALSGLLLAYGMALSGPLFFDDVPNLLANDLVQIGGGQFDDWRVAALSSESGVLFRPLAMVTFALNHVLSGEFTAPALKATNLAIHVTIALLAYCLTRCLLQAPALRALDLTPERRRLVALAAALIWLLHPIHVSTVLYVVQRMAQLATLFTVAGLLLFTHYRLRWARQGGTAGEVLAAGTWILLLTFFATLSKENGALLPWLLLVIEVTLFQGVWRGERRSRLAGLAWGCLLSPLVLLLGLFMFSPDALTAPFWGREFTLQERLLTQGRVLWQYAGWFFFPNILDMGFFHDDIALSRSLWSPVSTALALLAWGCVLGCALLWRKKYPLCLFAVLFYLVGHSMESSVLPLEMVFEHRSYLPGIALAILASLMVSVLVDRFRDLPLVGIYVGIFIILVVLLGLRTNAWRDEMTLMRFNVVNHPDSPRANFYYARTLFQRFRSARELGLPPEEEQALAVAARGYYERMHTLDARDFAALVMLYQLDTQAFPGLARDKDWLGVMTTLAQTRRLQRSDYTALGSLVDFVTSPGGRADLSRVETLLQALDKRYPGNLQMAGYRYRLARATGNVRDPALLATLELAAQMHPHSRQAAVYLAQYHGSEDPASTYESIREWLRRDAYRRELPAIRRIFDK